MPLTLKNIISNIIIIVIGNIIINWSGGRGPTGIDKRIKIRWTKIYMKTILVKCFGQNKLEA